MRRGWAAFFILAAPLRAEAAEAPLSLSWDAPADCPGRDAVRDGALRMLPAARAREPLRARGVVSREPGGAFRGEVRIGDDGDPRIVEGESCQAVSDAIELILAIAIDPDAPAALPADGPAPARTLSWLAGASALVGSGTFGGAAPGAELAIGAQVQRVVVEAAFGWLSARHATLAERPSEGASAWDAAATARGCFMLLDRAIDVGPCVGAGVSWVVAQGFGAAEPGHATAIVVAPLSGLRAQAALTRAIWLRAVLEAALPLSRPTFVIDNGGTIEHTAQVTLRAGAGAECRF